MLKVLLLLLGVMNEEATLLGTAYQLVKGKIQQIGEPRDTSDGGRENVEAVDFFVYLGSLMDRRGGKPPPTAGADHPEHQPGVTMRVKGPIYICNSERPYIDVKGPHRSEQVRGPMEMKGIHKGEL